MTAKKKQAKVNIAAANDTSTILKRLLFDHDMKPADLSRELGIPKPTLHRLISGKSMRPHISSLQPIADYFALSVKQLTGDEPITKLGGEPNQAFKTQMQLSWVPVYKWNELHKKEKAEKDQFIPMPGDRIEDAFATILPDNSMEPLFAKGNVLIFDPNKEAAERSFVLAKLNQSNEFVFRQLLTDGNHQFLKPLHPDSERFQLKLLEKKDQIVGTLVESRCSFNE